MTKILLYKKNHIINSTGGAEKIMISYANEFTKRGYEVILATRDEKKGKLFFNIDKKVTFKHFDFSFSILRRFVGKTFEKIGLLKHFAYFNRELLVSKMLDNYCKEEKPDVIILCGTQELVDFAYKREYDCPIILMMHSHPKQYFKKKRIKLYNKYINQAQAVQVLMSSFAKALPDCYQGKIVTIGNPVYNVPTKNEKKENIIIYIARISQSKQQHLLIEAFSQIANEHKDWQVHMYGAGEDNYINECKKLISEKGLENQIYFLGTTNDVYSVLERAKICAFPSAFEGFALAMTEAMSKELPVVAFDYCTAVNEIIVNNENGFLVKDVNEYAKKLNLLITDEKLRTTLGQNAKKITETYSPDNIMNKWQTLINEVINNK